MAVFSTAGGILRRKVVVVSILWLCAAKAATSIPGYQFVEDHRIAARSGATVVRGENPAQGFAATIGGFAVDLAGSRFAEAPWRGTVEIIGQDQPLVRIERDRAVLAADGLVAEWTNDPAALSLALELRAPSSEIRFGVRGDLLAVPSGSADAVALVAPRSGAVLLLRIARAEGADGTVIPASFEVLTRGQAASARIVLDLDGAALPATVVLRLARNVRAEGDSVPATCGMTGSLTATEDRDAFRLPGKDLAGSLVLVSGSGGPAPVLTAAEAELRLSPAPGTPGGAYEIDWLDRASLARPTPESEPNDGPDLADVAAGDVFAGMLDSVNDRDSFGFAAGAGDRILVAAELAPGAHPAMVLTVRDESEQVVASGRSDDASLARTFDGAAVAFRAPADARYVVELAAAGDWDGPVGAYTLAVSRNCSSSFVPGAPWSGASESETSADSGAPARSGLPAVIEAPASPATGNELLLAAPPEVDDSLRLSKSGGTATISWTAAAGTFNVYRGSRAAGAAWAYNQSCFQQATTSLSATDAGNPGSGEFFYYLVSRQSGCDESALGRNSAGVATPASGLCFSPATGVLPAKPYFMVAFDTSGSMTSAVPVAPTCSGFPADRLGAGRCALRNMFQAFGGQVNFGLATYAAYQTGCGSSCPGPGQTSTCAANCFSAEVNTTGFCAGCGPRPGNAATRAGANIVVPMQRDNFWDPTLDPSNLNSLLTWVDNNCSGNFELFAAGNTPLNGVLRDMFRYYSNQWTPPDGGTTLVSPLSAQDRACRSVNVILITDGDETCDTQADAVNAAAALFNGFSRGGITWKVKTYVINFAGGSQANTDAIAAAGGTTASYFATNETQLSQALATIVGGAATREACDNLDNNCNGCIDEGTLHYANVQTAPGACCAWATAAQRTTCLSNYRNSITPALPQGNPALLPCTTVEQQADSTTWLCYDPGETCDGIDNNGDGSIDEGLLRCGIPLHCPTTEICNGLDDDCDGAVDEGGVCPGGCVASPEICDGCDNDCDGIADNGVASVACGQPNPPNCAGTQSCKPPQPVAVGGCTPTGGWNVCANAPVAESCDGLDNDCNGAVDDSAACPCASRQEICNGLDDNCNGSVDEGVTPPSPAQVCGVSPAATAPECTSQVTVACVGGAFQCTFPAGVCSGVGGCAGTAEVCDSLDNNCDGRINENVPKYGEPCASDDGLPPPGQGACRTTGTYVCTSPTTTACSAVPANCASLPGGCEEVCDGIDNDCDGLVDEPFTNKGSNASFFVKPDVVKTAASVWEFAYEASRPSADSRVAGLGNGYFTSAPAGTPIDKTSACSAAGRIPWFSVTGAEAEQTCQAMGGSLCSLAQWQTGCTTNPPSGTTCFWGYSPRGSACTSTYTPSKYCNLGPSYDFNPALPGDQDGLLATGSAVLKNCYDDWSSLLSNPVGANRLYDVTGNLRELVKVGTNVYAVMGGAFNSTSESGSTCSFTFYQVDQNYSGYDVGFRCCFSANPRQ